MELSKNKNYRWLVLFVLVLAFTSTFLSRFTWSPVLGVASGDLGITMADAGNLMSAFYFGYLFTQIPGGFLADKFRVKYMMAGCVALVGIMTFAMSYAVGYTDSYAIRFAGGIFSGAIMAFCSRILSNYFAPAERGRALGILLASPSLGTLLANQIAPRIMMASGWRMAFKVSSVIILVVAILIILIIKEPKVEKATGKNKVSFVEGLKNYFTNKQIMILSVAGFLFMAVPIGYSTWANKFITGELPGGLGLDVSQATVILTVYSVLAIVGSISSGFIQKKFNLNPKHFIIFIFAVMAGSIFLVGKQTSYMGCLVVSGIFGLFSCMASTHLTSWAINIGGNKYAATTTAVQNFIFQSANVIFPTLAGRIIDGNTVNGAIQSFSGVWLLYASLMVVAVVVMFLTSAKSASEATK